MKYIHSIRRDKMRECIILIFWVRAWVQTTMPLIIITQRRIDIYLRSSWCPTRNEVVSDLLTTCIYPTYTVTYLFQLWRSWFTVIRFTAWPNQRSKSSTYVCSWCVQYSTERGKFPLARAAFSWKTSSIICRYRKKKRRTAANIKINAIMGTSFSHDGKLDR